MKIGNKKIAIDKPTLFIADIAANHDGNINKAIDLIHMAKESGANAAKFQHFQAKTIVSDYGFKRTGKIDHQSKWKKSVFKIYDDASLNIKWTKTELICARAEYSKVLESFAQGTKFVTDKLPVNFKWIGLIKILYPKAKIIHLIRNPMDTCLSNYRNLF